MSQPARRSSGQSEQPALLATKTFLPRAREGLIARPRLMGRLDDSLKGALTLVSAPAGFGKTTVLAEWLAGRPNVACWLFLDAADNDVARFLSYVIAALQTLVPGAAEDLAASLRDAQPPSVETAITALANELAAVPRDVSLVIDDYHVITSQAVNGALTLLLENLPPNVHLIIATRSDPAIPIARLRSHGQVVEIRAEDLRFTPDEAAAFLGQTMGLDLSAEQVSALEARTEGWIAGLQMAALSMRGRDDLDGFIRAFAGTNRYILDFLVEEVLSREPEDVQSFLLQTSILTRLSGPLCDFVTGAPAGREMLERLERRNLFVVSLDDDRTWYRYHHLFADLLQARLRQSAPDSVGRLCSRAAKWCEQAGQTAEAVDYAIAAKDYGRASGLIVGYWGFAASNGEIETVWSWLRALPEETVRRSAALGVAYCWVLWLNGHIGLMEPRLDDAERALSGLGGPGGLAAQSDGNESLPAEIAALRSIVARYHTDFATAVARAERALELLPPDLPPRANAKLRALISLALATANDGAGDLERAVGAYDETIRWSRLGGNTTGVAGITLRLTGFLRLLGRLRAADEALREAFSFVEERGLSRLPAAGLLQLAVSELLVERNELQAAEGHLSQGIEHGRGSGRLGAARGIAIARLRAARGDGATALLALEEADAALGQPPSPLARAELLAVRARILARQGDLTQAAQCADEAVRLAGRDRGQTGDMAALAASRVRIARGEPNEAVAELTHSLEAAEASGRLGTALELRILRSLALERSGDWLGARADLERALAMAEPEGYARVFLDEGQPMADLLRRLAARPSGADRRPGYSAAYLRKLLDSLDAPAGNLSESIRPGAALPPSASSHAAQPTSVARSFPVVEPLSERELQVLRLMAEGLTNERIASRLIIALGTVKAHIHNISGKLGAQNRAQAVARAKELGLL